MDITINPASGAGQHFTQAPIKAPAVDTHPTPAAPQVTAPAPSGQSDYEDTIRQAALSFKNVYAVSDTDFTIFKDATGKYITRYVSLRDGSVTYVPEPTLVKELALHGASPHLSINA